MHAYINADFIKKKIRNIKARIEAEKKKRNVSKETPEVLEEKLKRAKQNYMEGQATVRRVS